MGSVSLSSTIYCCKLIPNSFALRSRTKALYNFPLKMKLIHRNLHRTAIVCGNSYSPLSSKTLVQRRLSSKRNRGLMQLPSFSSVNRGSGEEEDCKAMETVLKLYKAIKNKNLQELSEIIADECQCVCSFLQFFQFFHGKKRMMEFFSYLMRNLGPNIEFFVQPTLHEGISIGISWRLEWKQNHVQLVKGFSFYTCHVYQGKVVLRNVKMVMEPLLQIEPIKLKVIEYVMNALDKMGSKRAVHISLILFFMATWLFLSL